MGERRGREHKYQRNTLALLQSRKQKHDILDCVWQARLPAHDVLAILQSAVGIAEGGCELRTAVLQCNAMLVLVGDGDGLGWDVYICLNFVS